MEWRATAWYLIAGVLLVAIGAAGPIMRRLWLTTSMLYLAVGIAVGPQVLSLLRLNLISNAAVLERVTEVAVIISLFAAGLKLRLPLADRRWIGPVLLASATMVVTVALTTGLGVWLLSLPLGMAILLGAAMAPTDPVLASEVQVDSPDDQDRLRVTLTGEAGLNDGTAFPFVLLAVGVCGLSMAESPHELGAFGWRWVVIDLLWRISAGLAVGWWGGCALARLAIFIRSRINYSTGSDEMLSLGLISLIYGAALLVHSYAFLAVFAAAVALRRVEMAHNEGQSEREALDAARAGEDNDPQHAPAVLIRDQMDVADALEKLVQVTLVILVGVMLPFERLGNPRVWLFAGLMLLVVRPLAVYLTVWMKDVKPVRKRLAAWFGIRGVGTLYYLTHGFSFGLADAFSDAARLLCDVVLLTIAMSIIVHGITVTPLMRWYAKHHEYDADPTSTDQTRMPAARA